MDPRDLRDRHTCLQGEKKVSFAQNPGPWQDFADLSSFVAPKSKSQVGSRGPDAWGSELWKR